MVHKICLLCWLGCKCIEVVLESSYKGTVCRHIGDLKPADVFDALDVEYSAIAEWFDCSDFLVGEMIEVAETELEAIL